MKIKTDFVTNSSSTAYVCYIPESINLTEELILKIVTEKTIIKLIQNYNDDITDPTTLKYYIEERLKNVLEIIKDGKSIYEDKFGGDDDRIEAQIIYQLIDKLDCLVSKIELGGGGYDSTQFITEKDLENVRQKCEEKIKGYLT